MPIKSNALIVVAAVVAMSAGYWYSSTLGNSKNSLTTSKDSALVSAREKFSPIQGTILSPARKIAVPALIKDDSQVFTLADLTGHWSLLFFGYTHCPDICPTTMGVAAQAKKLAEQNKESFPQVIFISVDPERDAIATLGDYVRYFDKDFIAVTGQPELIKALTLQMSVVYMKMPVEKGADSDEYLIDHSSALLLLNPEGKLAAFLNPPHDATTILKDIKKVVNLRDM